jgi:hypothetical protein
MSRPLAEFGKLRPPYPVDHCALAGCERSLTDDVGVYLYRDLETGKLVVFCDDCARHVELNHGERFKLVPL